MEENVIYIKSGINVDASVKNTTYVKKDYIWNPATCSCKSGKCLGSIIDDSVNTCDKIIDKEDQLNNEERKTVPTKNHTCYYFDDIK